MKKIILPLLAIAAPAISFANVELISGFNFGQFIGAGEASTDGLNGTATGSINSNYAGSSVPGVEDSGIYKVNNAIESSYSAGSATIYWNGTNGSDAWDFSSGLSVYEHGSAQAVNHELVTGDIMIYGDDNNAGLGFNSGLGNDTFALVIDTTGFADYDPSGFGQPNDFNFTFSAFANSGGTATIEWFFNGNSLGEFTANAGDHQAFNLDLPVDFYGNSGTTLIGVVTGDLVVDNVQINGVSAIPEPASFAALAGALGLGFAAFRRRRAA